MNGEEGDTPLVSVIIPCYGQAHFLGEAIESVLRQSYQRNEIIVVDDGSPDHAREVAARYPGVRYIFQENRGLADARNTGIRESRGTYLVFLDADDRLLPDALQTAVEQLHTHPCCAFASGRFRLIRADGSPIAHLPTQVPIGADPYRTLLLQNHIGMHATVTYRRAIFDTVGGFDISLKACEDYDIYLRIVRTHRVCSFDRLVAEYRWHDENMSRDAARMLRTDLTVLGRQWTYVSGNAEYMRACRAGIRTARKRYTRAMIRTSLRSLACGRWSRIRRVIPDVVSFSKAWLLAILMEARVLALARHGERSAPRQSHPLRDKDGPYGPPVRLDGVDRNHE
jgi:glycosyltransferase involved in cell wall biosynthesis